jgi:ubiquinone/menaquinone biosynthesis C-methylase UbiE
MFNNWVSLAEACYVFRALRRDPRTVWKLASRLPLPRTEKVKATWSLAPNPAASWWDVPAVRARWNVLISGDGQVDHCDYVGRKYWAGRDSLRALSLACGDGTREVRWAETGKFSRIDAYDLSECRVRAAAKKAGERGVGDVIRFHVRDVFDIDAPDGSYDVILGEGALHHLSPLETILRTVDRWLKPDGYLIVNDFVGPTRFQWTRRQLEAVNALLALLPERYKTLWNSPVTKLNVIRPSRLGMLLRDPSEAAESSRIMPLLGAMFDVLEVKGYGGSVLHLLLKGIAHHFTAPDEEGEHWLRTCCEVEDLLLARGDLGHDYVVAVCKRRAAV